jgi:hypothetical protein
MVDAYSAEVLPKKRKKEKWGGFHHIKGITAKT